MMHHRSLVRPFPTRLNLSLYLAHTFPGDASVRIVVADDLPASALDLLRAEGWTIDARSGRTPDQLKIDLADADAIVVRSATKVTPDIIAAAPKLRAIARAGTG